MKHTVDLKLWRAVDHQLNISAMLGAMYNIDKITIDEHTVILESSNEDIQISRRDSYGKALAMVSQLTDMTTFLNVVEKSTKKENEEVFVFNRFSHADDPNLIIYPIRKYEMMNIIPEYCMKFYKDKYDFRFTPDNGFQNAELILYIDKMDELMEDLTFLRLKDGDIGKVCEYKLKNMIPFEEYVDDNIFEEEEV